MRRDLRHSRVPRLSVFLPSVVSPSATPSCFARPSIARPGCWGEVVDKPGERHGMGWGDVWASSSRPFLHSPCPQGWADFPQELHGMSMNECRISSTVHWFSSRKRAPYNYYYESGVFLSSQERKRRSSKKLCGRMKSRSVTVTAAPQTVSRIDDC